MLALVAAAFLSGLLGSLHCVAMCGAFAVSCGRQRGGLPAWHLGRIATYGVLGAVAGALGRVLPGPAWLPATVASLFLVWFALALAGLVRDLPVLPRQLEAVGQRSLATPTVSAQALFGVVNGLLPCGLVYAALTVPVALGDPLRGAGLMLAFGAGTIPALTVAARSLQRVTLNRLWQRRLLAIVILTTGLWAIWTRATAIPTLPHHEMSVQWLDRDDRLSFSG